MRRLIKITSIGLITLDIPEEKSAGYGYDIPFDQMNIPMLPLGRLLKEKYDISDRIQISYARPACYEGLIKAFFDQGMTSSLYKNHIRDYFTSSFYDHKQKFYVRSLKKNMVLYAYIDGDENELTRLLPILESVDHIGAEVGPVTGEVKIEITGTSDFSTVTVDLNKNCCYNRLDYSVLLISPACIYAPYMDGTKSYYYIPGSYILKLLGDRWEGIRCSNAYISSNGRRFLPIPACVSLVKLNKSMLHYRLAPGKDRGRVEQDVPLTNAYTYNIDSHFVEYMVSETGHYPGPDGKDYDALSAGQVFSGSIYGNDRQIREIFEYLKENKFVRLGRWTSEGLGEAVVRITGLSEEAIACENLAVSFDLRCLSNTMIMNSEGMSDLRAEALSEEIEYVLGVKDRLEIIEKYTNDFNDYMENPVTGCPRNAVRMFAGGTVLRMKTRDNQPIDIFKLKHCFIGERTDEGYGEIAAYPALGTYYRTAENMPVPEI